MTKLWCILSLVIELSCPLFGSQIAEISSYEDFSKGVFSGSEGESLRGSVRLQSRIASNDSFDYAPKNSIWTGTYTAQGPGFVRSPVNSYFSSISFPSDEDYDVEVKVNLASDLKQAGLYTATTQVGIWLSQAVGGQVSVGSSFGNPQLCSNGSYLRIKRTGDIESAYFRTNRQNPWTIHGSKVVAHAAGIIVLGAIAPFVSGSHSGQGDFSEYKIRPYLGQGIWTSETIDLSSTPTTTGTISWQQDEPAGTNLEIRTASSNDGFSWGNWSENYNNSSGSLVTSTRQRYLRIGVTMYADANSQLTPSLDSIHIEYPDATPLGPVITPQSHPSALWSSPTALSLLWAMPAGNPAPESTYTYWLRRDGVLAGTASATVIGAAGSAHALSVPLPQEGSYTLDLQVTGDATSGGRTATAQTYSFGYDGSVPGQTSIDSPTHPQLLFTNNRNPVFRLLAADSVSGVSGYAAVLDKAATGDPGNVVNAGTELRYASLDNGTWYLHARAIDKAGNAGPISHYGIRVDFNGALLSQDYVKALPNPVRSDKAKLEYELAAPATELTLEFLNSQGEVLKSVDGSRNVGKNYYQWDVGNLANGVYLFRVKARSAEDGKSYSVVRKVAVIR